MATSSFYNDNLFRAYPFQFNPEDTLETLRLVAARVTVSFSSPFVTFPTTLLRRWQVLADSHVLHFVTRDSGATVLVILTIPKDQLATTRTFTSAMVQGVRIQVTIGELDESMQTWSGEMMPLEPTCTLWLRHRGISRIQVINENRERLTSVEKDPDGEDTPQWILDAYASPIWVQSTLFENTGFLLNAGFNCLISTSVTDNRVSVTPSAGSGSGEVDGFISLGDTVSSGSRIPEPLPSTPNMRPDGLPDHGSMIFSFCGAGGPEVVHGLSSSIVMRTQYGPNTVTVSVAGMKGKSC